MASPRNGRPSVRSYALSISLLFILIAAILVSASALSTPHSLVSSRRQSAILNHLQSSFARHRHSTVMGAAVSTQSPSSFTKKYFNGKNVLLTGASGGLGKALALQLAQSGVSTLILSARSQAALDHVAQECQASSVNELTIHCIICDLSDPDSVALLATKALEVCSHRIDMLINNGGVSSRSSFLETSSDVDRLVMQVNFLAGAALAKQLVPGMVQRNHGRIVWISSVQGLLGIPYRSSYAASKFAVQGYCESIRAELAGAGVKVTVVSPGYIKTNLSNSAITGDGSKYGKTDETTAAGADPVEVATTILNAAAKGQAELVVAAGLSAKVAIWLRFLFPSLLRRMLIKRYEKASKIKAD
ncbi:hypothetical protein MPSEU_000459700 [Mayamaea pseudoterrestris]|nr:hypothetical protein MPSEU_000459700 [Mayamaea pseudoterrestris]